MRRPSTSSRTSSSSGEASETTARPMTSSAWLAVGAIVASLAGPGLGPGPLALLASAAAIGGLGVRRAGWRSRRHGRQVVATLVGVVAITVRLTMAGWSASPTAGPSLPDGSGPWMAEVVSVSAARDGQQVATVAVEIPDGAADARGGRTVQVAATLPRYPAIEPGELVRVDGKLAPPPEGPYGTYLERIGVEATIRSRGLTILGRDESPSAGLERLRRGAGAALAEAIPEPEAGLAAGIVIGLRDRVDRDLAAAFTTVGASHIVAISGWNIAIVAATVAALVGSLGRRRRAVVLSAAILAYVLFAGASPSVVRAAAMAGVVLLARETGRAGRATAALGWAAALLLIADPHLVGDAGFQLSSLATGGILAWANPLTTRLSGLLGGRLPHWLCESLGVSLAAQAATLPIVLLTFGRLALISPLVNLLIVPLVAPAMAAALLALLGGAAALLGAPSLVAMVTGLPAWVLLTTICTVVRVASAVPLANVTLVPPWTMLAAALTAALIVAGPIAGRHRHAFRRPARKRDVPMSRPANAAVTASTRARRGTTGRPSAWTRVALVALVASLVGLGLAIAHRADGSTRITVLDVGQGDSILVEGGAGGRMLVDGGPDPDRLLVELDRHLPPWDRRIDILILTHPHEDHVAGLPLLLERYRIGRIFETGMRGPGPGYAAFARDLAGSAAPPHAILATGARISLDDIRLRVLWPDPGRVPREPPDAGRGINDVSIVLLGEIDGRRFLLTGDVEDDVDPLLAARGLPPIDILKVAHHGSATASTPAFLDSVRPRVAIVSAGAGNPYGHPARSTIERLQATGAQVLRTDTDGTVAVTIAPSGDIGVTASGARRTAAASASPGRGAESATPPLTAAAPGFDMVPRAVAWSCGIPSSG